MPHTRPIIHIIDNDASVRRALGRVMTSAGLEHRSYESAEAFLAAAPEATAGCIVTDMTLPVRNGLDLKQALNRAALDLPVIFLTANDTQASREAAREAGAGGYFRKPVDTQALLDAVLWALEGQASELPA